MTQFGFDHEIVLEMEVLLQLHQEVFQSIGFEVVVRGLAPSLDLDVDAQVLASLLVQ